MPATPSTRPVTPGALRGIRPVADTDATALTALVEAAYAEYPGCVMDLPGVDADLTAPGTEAARRGGRWWVVESDGRIIASVGTGPLGDDAHVELKRLYLDRAARGRGLASALVERVEAHAAGVGAVAVELWSDTRFDAAHHRYRQLGYAYTGSDRRLHDPSNTTEHRFVKHLERSTPRIDAAWLGPHGEDRCELVALPDGTLLRGEIGTLRYDVELDAPWRTRRAQMTTPHSRLRLTSDGAGRWWRDGATVERLAGCLDVDLEVTPATNLLPIRRLTLPIGGVASPTAAWVRADGTSVEPLEQRYERSGPTTWDYRAGTFGATIEVDERGLPVTYTTVTGERLWTRAA